MRVRGTGWGTGKGSGRGSVKRGRKGKGKGKGRAKGKGRVEARGGVAHLEGGDGEDVGRRGDAAWVRTHEPVAQEHLG